MFSFEKQHPFNSGGTLLDEALRLVSREILPFLFPNLFVIGAFGGFDNKLVVLGRSRLVLLQRG